MCSFFIPTSIALSCSARTDVLNCSAGTDGAETDRFFLLPTNFFSLRCFFLTWGKCIIENSDVSQWLLLVSFIQNHSAITQLFYVTTSSSLKPIVHDLLYSEMLRERNYSPSWKVKKFSALRAGTLPALAQHPPISQHLPTPLQTVNWLT